MHLMAIRARTIYFPQRSANSSSAVARSLKMPSKRRKAPHSLSAAAAQSLRFGAGLRLVQLHFLLAADVAAFLFRERASRELVALRLVHQRSLAVRHAR